MGVDKTEGETERSAPLRMILYQELLCPSVSASEIVLLIRTSLRVESRSASQEVSGAMTNTLAIFGDKESHLSFKTGARLRGVSGQSLHCGDWEGREEPIRAQG